MYRPSDFDIYLFHKGELKEAYKHFGSHVIYDNNQKPLGTRFTVYAPNAKEVCVIGDFNNWMTHPMTKINNQGIWYTFIEGVFEHEHYEYRILTWNNKWIDKLDPYGFYHVLKPTPATEIYSIEGYEWNDQNYLEKQKQVQHEKSPMLIYELHLGTWKRKENGDYYTYTKLADELIPYLKNQGFTHIQILPLIEHPMDGSWGYQATGYFSPTNRYGQPKELMYFIDQCHQADLSVIVDFVPGFFSKSDIGLYMFDGRPVYGYPLDDLRENVVTETANFDLGKHEVRSFLLSSALFWIDYFHVDGFKIDKIENIIYWLGDRSRGINHKAIEFLRILNSTLLEKNPNLLLIAEDSTDFPMVTKSVKQGGLGFNYKWNKGWMNDALEYFEEDPLFRRYIHQNITFGLVYAFSEPFILPLPHEEVIHGKKSLVNKMPGDYWQKFANYRLLMGLLMTHPGKKLIFMGGEFAHIHEWDDTKQLDWKLMTYPSHESSNRFVRDLTTIYHQHNALYEMDHEFEKFEWIDSNNSEQSIFSFVRKTNHEDELLVIVINATPLVYHHYKIGVPIHGVYEEIINSDRDIYGGSNIYNNELLTSKEEPMHQKPYHIQMALSPLGMSIMKLKHRL